MKTSLVICTLSRNQCLTFSNAVTNPFNNKRGALTSWLKGSIILVCNAPLPEIVPYKSQI